MNLNQDDISDELRYFLNLGVKVKKSGLKNLELQFYHTELNDEDFDKLLTLRHIESLVFYLSNIDDSRIEKLSEIATLKKLGIYSCKNVTNLSIATLTKLNLQELFIIDTGITDEGKLELKSLVPNTKLHMKLS
jgi:hypothetical protein